MSEIGWPAGDFSSLNGISRIWVTRPRRPQEEKMQFSRAARRKSGEFLGAARVVEPLEARVLLSTTVAYWRFEEGSPGPAPSTPGFVLDSSGNNLNGTAGGEPTYRDAVPVSPIPQTGAPNTR